MIKLWAFIYRKTGWKCPLVEIYEYRNLRDQIKSIEESYKDPDNDIPLEDLIGINIGLWQAKNGFIRPWKSERFK